jgi:DNA-binding transcriptional LysR family regulator
MTDLVRAMQAYVAVCDLNGFAPAARRLGAAPSAVTRMIASLEQELGVRLLNRTTRAVSQTDAGVGFLEHARRILDDIEEARLSVGQEQAAPRGRLVVSAPLLFGRMHVAPAASRFLDRYPGVQIELTLSDRYVNLVEEGVDVAIRIGPLVDSALIARRIGATRRMLVASPGYLSRHGTPGSPAELKGHSLILFHAGEQRGDWRFADGQQIHAAKFARFWTDSADAAIGYALDGGGIAAVFCYQAAEAVADGRLVEVLPEFALPPVPIQALFTTRRLLSAKVRAFLDLLEDSAADGAWDAV